MASLRKIIFQSDVLEWVQQQRSPINVLRKERYKMEKGFVAYWKDFQEIRRERARTKDEKEKKPSEATESSASVRAMQQYYESEELIKQIKWKRVTWDEDADYGSFSKRILSNWDMFKNAPAFSFMSIHVVRDPTTTTFTSLPPVEKLVKQGDLTNWLLQERDPTALDIYPVPPRPLRKSAFEVDWVSGEVRILDTASSQEIITFLLTVAPRLQAVQLKMEEQQRKQTEDVENVRVRVGATLKFNKFDTSYWDAPERKTSPDYVTPGDMEQFLKGMLRTAFLFRWFLKGQYIRVLPPGKPYYVDMQNKELHLPANFADYNYLRVHSRFEGVENRFNSFRRFWWFWMFAAMVIVGDVDIF